MRVATAYFTIWGRTHFVVLKWLCGCSSLHIILKKLLYETLIVRCFRSSLKKIRTHTFSSSFLLSLLFQYFRKENHFAKKINFVHIAKFCASYNACNHFKHGWTREKRNQRNRNICFWATIFWSNIEKYP